MSESSPTPRKKRGRPRKKKETPLPLPPQKEDSEKELILHLALDPKKLPKKVSQPPRKKKSKLLDPDLFLSPSMPQETQKQCDVCLKLQKKIERLERKLTRFKELSSFLVNRNRAVYPLSVPFIRVGESKTFKVTKTDVACDWCTEPFDNLPFFLPDRFQDGKFYVLGCFCSCNCAAAFNRDLRDYKVGERHSLLQHMFSLIYKTDAPLLCALPRKALQKFRGKLTLKEFRDLGRLPDKEFRVVYPPMVPLIPFLVEDYRDKATSEEKHSFADEPLVLKRTKPLPRSSANILSFMSNKKA